MANTYSIGGAAPTHASVSAFVLSQAQWLAGVHAQAENFWRTYTMNLQTDQEKTNAGVDFATFPDDKYRLDVLASVMNGLRIFLENGDVTHVVDTRDLCAQIIIMGS